MVFKTWESICESAIDTACERGLCTFGPDYNRIIDETCWELRHCIDTGQMEMALRSLAALQLRLEQAIVTVGAIEIRYQSIRKGI